ncbi:MAG: glutamate mutase L [Oscillospiraceae bacterium]|nr:glutamate mutase L [Oscillospiraceae bacterium]
MRAVLLIDFGSTNTKVTAVDLDTESLLGTAAAYTTVETDVGEGLANAIAILEKQTGKLDFVERYACSSAAGGLRMIASGLVPELTAEAAKMASLGAGAKILKVYSFEMTEDDADEIRAAKPDIVLLVGGTDGGNTDCIVHNAKLIAGVGVPFPVVVAGNRNAAKQCREILEPTHQTYVCENVMPKFGQINIEPTQKQIREIFLGRIVQAKGLSEASELISGILMPTPSAMMKAMQLLAEGTEDEPGIGELLAVDVGGATTDVYTIAEGKPGKANTVYKGLPEPYIKRTVEGDVGMRYSVHGIVDACGIGKLAKLAGIGKDRAQEMIDYLAAHTDALPQDDEWERLDHALASMAIDTAVTRHVGKLEEAYTMLGVTYVQSGKDMTNCRQIVVTGGSLIHTKKTGEIAAHALFDPENPASLKPRRSRILVDRKYILAGMGLLSEKYPEIALRIMKRELSDEGEQVSAAPEPKETNFVPMTQGGCGMPI